MCKASPNGIFSLSASSFDSISAFFSASAASAPELLAQGAANVQVGDKYTVSIRLNDASDVVGGFQGELAYTGATVDTILANPEVKDFNNTDDDTTVVKDDGNSVNFVTVSTNGKILNS